MRDNEPTREPTPEECYAKAIVQFGSVRYMAYWYPQMGGYTAKSWTTIHRPGECFDAFVWHDGEFPFGSSGSEYTGPNRVHHCAAEQFIDYGQSVIDAQLKVAGELKS